MVVSNNRNVWFSDCIRKEDWCEGSSIPYEYTTLFADKL